MSMKSLITGAMSVVLMIAAGCAGRSLSFHFGTNGPTPRRVAYVNETHHCSYECDEHYWTGSRVVVLSGHRHGRDCGHHWNGDHWLVIHKNRAKSKPQRKHKSFAISIGHEHDVSCGCAYDRHGHKWVVVKSRGHVHRRGCGHVYISGRWSLHH